VGENALFQGEFLKMCRISQKIHGKSYKNLQQFHDTTGCHSSVLLVTDNMLSGSNMPQICHHSQLSLQHFRSRTLLMCSQFYFFPMLPWLVKLLVNSRCTANDSLYRNVLLKV